MIFGPTALSILSHVIKFNKLRNLLGIVYVTKQFIGGHNENFCVI